MLISHVVPRKCCYRYEDPCDCSDQRLCLFVPNEEGKLRALVQWLPQLLTMMGLADSYVDVSHIRCPPMLTIYTAQILEMLELSISVISIVSMIVTHDRITSDQTGATRLSLLWLDVTGTYLTHPALRSTKHISLPQSSGRTIFLVSNPFQEKNDAFMLL